MQGLILLDKPEGITSFGAVAAVRRCFCEKRAGHTGTLDPFATGVLPVLLGRATRLSSFMLESNKAYIAEVTLGITTDTLDITGSSTSTSSVDVSDRDIESVLAKFMGKIKQIPPMYSAVHKDGKRLYELAREGKNVQREAREVQINSLELISYADNKLILFVDCSKGTYIRTLADDIGKMLGCGATVSKLRRTVSNGFSIENCVTLDQLRKDPDRYLLSAETAVMHLPEVCITDNQASRVMNGGSLLLSRCGADSIDGVLYRIKHRDEMIALGQVDLGKDSLMIKCLVKEEIK